MDFDHKLLEYLVQEKLISQQVADEIRLSSINTGNSSSEILLQKHLIDEDKLLAAKSKIYHVPMMSLAGRGISPEILTFIPEPVARKYKLIPFDFDKKTNKLSLALTDPLDLPLLEFLELKSGKSIVAYISREDEISSKIDEVYSQGLASEVTEALKDTSSGRINTVDVSQISQIIKEAPIAKIVSTILEYAVKSRASDIHIEPQESRTRVRYRIDGILHERLALPRTVNDAVVSRIKILSDMKIDERRIPQDGRFNFKIGPDEVDLRVSSLPTVHGEKIVMRLLKKTGGIPSLTDLGLGGVSLKGLEYAITRPHGIILVTGPTGSGKTTTLYSILSKLNTTKVNIVTLEDPVEYEIVGINQVQVNPLAGLTFASGLRSFLRQDPNIILVGEIRDRETVGLAIQAALTGHLVFSTLHTNNAATTIPRLLDLGAEPFLIVSVLNAIEAQRIVRRVCATCKESYVPTVEMVNDFKTILGNLLPVKESEMALYKGKGCKECNNTGYLGRIGIYESISISQEIAKMILERSTAEDIERQAKKEGMITMKQDGYLKALEGITTIEEVLRVAQE
ncbi:type II secretion system protein GspE [Candidatus Gottesmanbacteria bacterium CG11_big_fil_rev_8_21_14_0_20_37_11]|uniref:Type II secretion system protein GspE n=1 Tax=Candidatus Gottesmanbacteria bacterium CG11_big_fil_rev_8_21_14_0_20_37_11 TaxID=1974575 RepID=A0A2H0NFH1_9BACT|nr:MAG: type II secretion system protein GspE [Candidatus Gottesmanbacteria bacterium CG23_combo_of_CG06-09_8_20_14_all_37_19]PIR07640.1 MAG: type II secretion system protein GspE [Candidatus Gottesmanbacteria bacterium CG11_big_fil_rev_8_21_14_0_20_37_11]